MFNSPKRLLWISFKPFKNYQFHATRPNDLLLLGIHIAKMLWNLSFWVDVKTFFTFDIFQKLLYSVLCLFVAKPSLLNFTTSQNFVGKLWSREWYESHVSGMLSIAPDFVLEFLVAVRIKINIFKIFSSNFWAILLKDLYTRNEPIIVNKLSWSDIYRERFILLWDLISFEIIKRY